MYKLVAGDSIRSFRSTLHYDFHHVRLAGRPDALFRHRIFFWMFLLCELKSRQIKHYNPRVYDIVEVLLDAGLVKKNYLFSTVKIRIKYKDSVRHIRFNGYIFRQITDFLLVFDRHKLSNSLGAVKNRALELNNLIKNHFFR
jgi:hypothetical protein